MLVGLALAAGLVVLVGARVVQRRRRDEIRSIHHYHERLDTLHVEPHDRGGSVRVVDEVPAPVEHAPPDRPRLDPDAARLEPWSPTPTARERRRRHDRTWAIERMQPRARVDTGTLLVVSIVVAVLVAMAFAGYLIQRGRGAAPATTSTSTTRPVTGHSLGAPPAPHPALPTLAADRGRATLPASATWSDGSSASASGAQATGSNLAVKWRSCGGAATIL